MQDPELTLDTLLNLESAPPKIELQPHELERWFWKYRGLQKNQERSRAFWDATNKNLALAYAKLDHKERLLESAYSTIRNDLAVARKIQRALLPTPPPALKALADVAVYHEQLREVGGDYYDYFVGEPDGLAQDMFRVFIGVFDISGHGVSAALIVTYLKALFTQAMHAGASPRRVVEWVNDASINFLREVKMYATVNFVQLLPHRIRYVCGGGIGMLLRADGTEHAFVRRDHFLGLRDRGFTEYELEFEVGDLLALYTDGIVESQDSDGRDYTTRRLNQLIRTHADLPAADIVAACVADYESFRARDVDDITLLILKHEGEAST